MQQDYDAVLRGLLHIHGCEVSDANLEACKKHFIWHRNALRKALEDPEMQTTDARYIGYLNGLRRMAKELSVQWPPYSLDEYVHDDVPEEALTLAQRQRRARASVQAVATEAPTLKMNRFVCTSGNEMCQRKRAPSADEALSSYPGKTSGRQSSPPMAREPQSYPSTRDVSADSAACVLLFILITPGCGYGQKCQLSASKLVESVLQSSATFVACPSSLSTYG